MQSVAPTPSDGSTASKSNSDSAYILPELAAPYLIFLGDITDDLLAKTGAGIVQWRRSLCLGQLRFGACRADIGLPDLSVRAAAAQGARSMILGAALVGGQIKDEWLPILIEAIESGMDIVAGFHSRLNDIPSLVAKAKVHDVRLIDVRVPPRRIPVGSGISRAGLRLLTVGTDCAVGKKYTALAIEQEMRARGIPATFRATGQTGIIIAGRGMPMDAVVADFLSGAAEVLSPDNAAKHWDVIEGQGSLFHPGYAAVSLGLLHGSQPDAIVLCHDPTRVHLHEYPTYAVPRIQESIQRNLDLGALTNPRIRCVGVSLNTSALSERAALTIKNQIAQETRLPCVDPIADGVGEIVDKLQEYSAEGEHARKLS